MKSFIALAILFAASHFAGVNAKAQDSEALRVVNAAVQKLGGEARIRGFKSIYVSGKGTENGSAAGQSYDPSRDSPTAHEEALAVFMDGVRLAYEYKTDRGDGTIRWRRTRFAEGRRTVADLNMRAVYAGPVTFPSIDRNQDARRIPHLLLLEVLANPAGLRYDGMRTDAGRAHDVVTVTLPNTEIPLALYFDKQTELLSKYEYTADFPALGAATIESINDNYHADPALKWFPSGNTIKINGRLWRSVTYRSAMVDSAEAEGMMQLPPDLEGFLTPPGTVKEIAPGVFLAYGLGGSFQPMFIEFKDFVVVVEAPAIQPSPEETPLESIGNMNAVSDELIAKIKQTIPDKPIKYVVITHSHSDHMGGLRAFLADKPTVLTSPGNKEFYQKFVPEFTIETFAQRREISDGIRTIELINVGKNPHTAENIVVYLPKENYLYQGDLFYFGGEATFPARDRMTVMPFFANWLKERGLKPARIYGLHSTLYGTMAHIEKIRAIERLNRMKDGGN